MKKRMNILVGVLIVGLVIFAIFGSINEWETKEHKMEEKVTVKLNTKTFFDKKGFGDKYTVYTSEGLPANVVLYKFENGENFILGEKTRSEVGKSYKAFVLPPNYEPIKISHSQIIFENGKKQKTLLLEKLEDRPRTYLTEDDFLDKIKIEKFFDFEKEVIKN